MILPRRTVLYLLLIGMSALFFAPAVWLLLTAVKGSAELAAYPVHWLPRQWNFGNFGRALTYFDYLGYARNSFELATVYAVLVTLSSAWAGFGFARLAAPGKKLMFGVLLSTMMISRCTGASRRSGWSTPTGPGCCGAWPERPT